MKVKDVMTRNILAVESDASIFDAAERMKNHDVGFLAVIRGNDIVGVVTDRDIVVRGLGARTEPGSGSVAQIMTKTLYTCFAEDNVEEAIKILEDREIRRLLVLDDMEIWKGPSGCFPSATWPPKGRHVPCPARY